MKLPEIIFYSNIHKDGDLLDLKTLKWILQSRLEMVYLFEEITTFKTCKAVQD